MRIPPKPGPAQYGPTRRSGHEDEPVAARRAATGRLVEELVDWRPWEEHRERYLWDEYNDGINDPEPCELRFVDLAVAPPLDHPIVAAMLLELSEYAAEAAGQRLLPDRAGMRSAWPPAADAVVVWVTVAWWTLVARHPGGPAVALLDGVQGLHDVTRAPSLGAALDQLVAALTP